MRRVIAIILGLSLSVSAFALNSHAALSTFSHDLQNIRVKLQKRKMNVAQAQILLSAIQVRQNNVIIAQNAEILKGMKHESK
jgi:hypothetical protein